MKGDPEEVWARCCIREIRLMMSDGEIREIVCPICGKRLTVVLQGEEKDQ